MLRSRAALFVSLICCGVLIGAATPAPPDAVVVDITPSHRIGSFRPLEAFGSTVDKDPAGSMPAFFSHDHVRLMLGAGLGWLSYRLYTEISVQDWHWNPRGTFSQGDRGYWTSDASANDPLIQDSYQYALPHRGFTTDQGDSASYSRLDDGDAATYWKSNPYLTSAFTHESDALHPQWIVVDLGASRNVDRVRISWGKPYATRYSVDYWHGPDPINDPGNGSWRAFPADGSAVKVRYVRVLMTRSSGTCDTHGASDVRNCVGYAVREIYIGHGSSAGFVDEVRHEPGPHQSATYVSSVDPWHAASDRIRNQEQPGLDLIARSGLTHDLGGTYAVPILYSTPENGVAEVRYLRARHYPIRMLELGEEPDGQYATPEDDAALYVQWARALHAVDPALRLGGPVFSGTNDDVQAWPDARGNVSWLNRFLRYLRAHGAIGELAFMSFEHYPFDGCEHGAKLLADLEQEPGIIKHIVATWRADGLPAGLPMYVTEANFSAVNFTQIPMQIEGGLWLADYFASGLSNGLAGVVYYQYEPVPITQNRGCPADWGNLTMFVADRSAHIRATDAQYGVARMLTQEWVAPGNAPHELFAATGAPGLTAYAVKRPEGSWSVMLVNKAAQARRVTLRFADAQSHGDSMYSGTVSEITYGAAQYEWHARGAKSTAAPNDPPVRSSVAASDAYDVPARSVTILRGSIAAPVPSP
jgi:hypothetical protein